MRYRRRAYGASEESVGRAVARLADALARDEHAPERAIGEVRVRILRVRDPFRPNEQWVAEATWECDS